MIFFLPEEDFNALWLVCASTFVRKSVTRSTDACFGRSLQRQNDAHSCFRASLGSGLKTVTDGHILNEKNAATHWYQTCLNQTLTSTEITLQEPGRARFYWWVWLHCASSREQRSNKENSINHYKYQRTGGVRDTGGMDVRLRPVSSSLSQVVASSLRATTWHDPQRKSGTPAV